MNDTEHAELTVGNCNCLTKTPDPKYHDKGCPVSMAHRIRELEIENQKRGDYILHVLSKQNVVMGLNEQDKEWLQKLGIKLPSDDDDSTEVTNISEEDVIRIEFDRIHHIDPNEDIQNIEDKKMVRAIRDEWIRDRDNTSLLFFASYNKPEDLTHGLRNRLIYSRGQDETIESPRGIIVYDNGEYIVGRIDKESFTHLCRAIKEGYIKDGLHTTIVTKTVGRCLWEDNEEICDHCEYYGKEEGKCLA